VSFDQDSSNPYAAPVAGAEAGGGRSFALADEVRTLISTTATLMIVGGLLTLIPTVVGLVVNGFATESLITAAIFGLIGVFTAVAGFSLRALARPGDDLGALLAGFRQLYVAYLVKGVVMLIFVGLMLLSLALSFIGVGVGFYKMWG